MRKTQNISWYPRRLVAQAFLPVFRWSPSVRHRRARTLDNRQIPVMKYDPHAPSSTCCLERGPSTMPRLQSHHTLRLSVLLLAAAVPCAWSQPTMGAVSGTVRDPSGAVVPNATVGLTNTATNISQNTNANEVGFYIFPDVAPGSYHLSVLSPGMQKFEGALVVRVAERLVIDPALKPGETLTQVEVKDITPLVSTDNPTVSTTLERERINQLPINGRSLNTMLGNLPGFEGDRLNGIFNDATEWVLDGAVVSDRRWNGAPSSQPPMDAIQEFTVVSNAAYA